MSEKFADMLGMQFSINFDASIMKLQGIANNKLCIETGNNNAENGSVSFS